MPVFLNKYVRMAAVFLLIAATAIAYGEVIGHQFLAWDDPIYVLKNEMVKGGLSQAGLKSAFTTFTASNWHPLTMISHMLDVEIFGLDPAGHHLTNLVFHIANALLLLLALSRATGSFWPSLFTAFLFALHPLHVESTAWISERKDLLSAFFAFLTINLYISWNRTRKPGFYILALACFALGLMSKSMLVTLPVWLLLMDYWPLQRLEAGRKDLPGILKEKIPFFCLSAIFSIVTFAAQKSGGSVAPLLEFSLAQRSANAILAYVMYLVKMFRPTNLSYFYPIDLKALTIWRVGGAACLLAVFSILAFLNRRKRPYIPAGWVFYLVTLSPVIGLIQVGGQAMADRYTYLPLLGPFIIIAWLGAELVSRLPRYKSVAAAAAILVIVNMALDVMQQVKYWHDSETLFLRALEIDPENWKAAEGMSRIYQMQGRLQDSIMMAEKSIRSAPKSQEIYWLLAFNYIRMKKYATAEDILKHALSIDSRNAYAYNGLGFIAVETKRYYEALDYFQKAARFNPGDAEYAKNLDIVETYIKEHNIKPE